MTRELIRNGADVNAVEIDKWTALHWAAHRGHVGVAKVLLLNGADATAVNEDNETSLCRAAQFRKVACTLQLLCFGAEIDNKALVNDETKLLRPIEDRLTSLRAGNGMETTLMSVEERRFMWNLAFFFTIAHRGAAFKAYHAIRSFITYNGIFMASGYDLGEGSIWRREE